MYQYQRGYIAHPYSRSVRPVVTRPVISRPAVTGPVVTNNRLTRPGMTAPHRTVPNQLPLHYVHHHQPSQNQSYCRSTPNMETSRYVHPQPDPQRACRQSDSDSGSCNICSYTQVYPNERVPLYHRHFSSLRLREYQGAEDTGNRYLCPSCKSRHTPYPEERIKIVVSDSSLHQFFAPPGFTAAQYPGDTMHVDYISIPEATIETIMHAFRLDYEHKKHTKPMDVLIVAGYNDLVIDHGRDYIMYRYKEFNKLVMGIGKEIHPSSLNTVAVASLLYPPQLTWYPDNGQPPANHVNRMEKLLWLNKAIHELNLANNVPDYPRFHTYGIRTATRRSRDVFGQEHHRRIKSHRWEHWEDLDPSRMLNLRNERRFKMGKAANNYFILKT